MSPPLSLTHYLGPKVLKHVLKLKKLSFNLIICLDYSHSIGGWEAFSILQCVKPRGHVMEGWPVEAAGLTSTTKLESFQQYCLSQILLCPTIKSEIAFNNLEMWTICFLLFLSRHWSSNFFRTHRYRNIFWSIKMLKNGFYTNFWTNFWNQMKYLFWSWWVRS